MPAGGAVPELVQFVAAGRAKNFGCGKLKLKSEKYPVAVLLRSFPRLVR
jgi:hypothetical protein